MSKARELANLGNAYSDGALSNRNKIINGAMTIDQRNGGSAVTNANGYITDRWTVGRYGPNGGSYTAQQVTDAPSGFKNSLKLTTTAVPSLNSDQYFQMFQPIEGYNIADFSFGSADAATFTFSFWVKSSLTGTFCVAFTNNQATTRSYVVTYTINAADTWEHKTVTVAGDTSAVGNWGDTNGQGLTVFFDIGSGTAQEASAANNWETGNFRRIAGAVRIIETSGATFQITGVQLEVGDTATPFEHRSYGQELALCQRYYSVIGGGSYVGIDVGQQFSTTGSIHGIQYPVPMRTSPSVSFDNLIATDRTIFDETLTGFSVVTAGASSAYIRTVWGTSRGAVGNAVLLAIRNGYAGGIKFDAEL